MSEKLRQVVITSHILEQFYFRILMKLWVFFQMVKLLLSRGANINAFDKKDRRAIHWAAYMGMYSLNLFFDITYLGKVVHFSSCIWYNICLSG